MTTKDEALEKMSLYKNHSRWGQYEYRITSEFTSTLVGQPPMEVFFLERKSECPRCGGEMWTRDITGTPENCPACKEAISNFDAPRLSRLESKYDEYTHGDNDEED